MDAKLQELCRQAHEDRIRVGMLDTDTKNRTLELAADALMAHEQEILEANATPGTRIQASPFSAKEESGYCLTSGSGTENIPFFNCPESSIR